MSKKPPQRTYINILLQKKKEKKKKKQQQQKTNHHLNLQGIVAVISKMTNLNNKEKVSTYRLIQCKVPQTFNLY